MTINILFIEDIIRKPELEMLQTWQTGNWKKYRVDVMIANAENAADGKGCTAKEGKIFFDLWHQLTTLLKLPSGLLIKKLHSR